MLKRIAVADLRLGMYINELCGSWMEHPFWRAKFLLSEPADLQLLQSSGISEVWIDTAKGRDTEARARSQTNRDVDIAAEKLLLAANSVTQQKRTSLDEEMRQAARLCAKSKEAIIEMFRDARMGKAVDVESAEALVEDISLSTLRHPHAFISLARLKNANEYTYMHSVAVCGLMIALARQLQMDEETVRTAGLAGLLHDIGKMMIDPAVLNKPGKLTAEEFDIMKSHPSLGVAILQGTPGLNDQVIDVCLHHHEKVDGTGYPHQLRADQISLLARMGAVCDVYDAITSDRPYKKGWSPAESIRKMAEWSKGHFDEAVFQAFVKAVGIYPIGSLVRLHSDRLGVVVEQDEQSLLTPKVKIFYSIKNKSAIPQRVINLAKLVGQDKIISRESAEDWGLKNIHTLWSDTTG